ncbi:MAG: hypothetical protein MZV49_25355 [Rhodopseudomonas palustris]|nr:hypothetical protein [Rhodopseudomonas palustris]
MKEIDDWNCCGATEYVGMNLIPAYSLIARNLALAAKQAERHQYRRGALLRLLPQPRKSRPLHG